MSKRDLIILVLFLILVTLFIFFYLYNKNDVYIPPVVVEDPVVQKEEAQREELKKYNTTKSQPLTPEREAQMRAELEKFTPAPGVKKATEEEMWKELLELNAESNP